MSDENCLGRQQLQVAVSVLAAITTLMAVIWAGFRWWPWTGPNAETLADRLALAIRCDLAVAAVLALMVGAIANGRFFSAQDMPGAGLSEPSPPIAVGRAVLQNTLEQGLLAVLVHLALAVLLRGGELRLIPMLAGLFVAGRLFFWAGYARGAGGRAFGFALTFWPTLLSLIYAIGLVASGR